MSSTQSTSQSNVWPVKANTTNQMDTQQTHQHTVIKTLRWTRRRNYSLRSSSPVMHAAAPPCKNAEFNKSYTNRIIFPCTIQISYQFQLNHHVFSRSNENIFEIQTYISSYMLISQPFQNLNICTSSTKQDLHIYVHKIAKGEIEFQLTWKCRLLNSCSQVFISSKSTLLYFFWSSKQESTVENSLILFNFQNRSTWRCSWTTRNLDE